MKTICGGQRVKLFALTRIVYAHSESRKRRSIREKKIIFSLYITLKLMLTEMSRLFCADAVLMLML